jgi:hypothetical protein
MKRPTITKLQTINALVEIKRRDHEKFHEESTARLACAEKDMEDELKRVLKDPARIAMIIAIDEGHDPDVRDTHRQGDHRTVPDNQVEYYHDGEIRINTVILPEVAALRKVIQKCQEDSRRRFDEHAERSMLEDKLTGCDPESLLSVPENVANMRTLLNGLLLLPQSYDQLSA